MRGTVPHEIAEFALASAIHDVRELKQQVDSDTLIRLKSDLSHLSRVIDEIEALQMEMA